VLVTASNDLLGLQVPDDDSVLGTSAQPAKGRVELANVSKHEELINPPFSSRKQKPRSHQENKNPPPKLWLEIVWDWGNETRVLLVGGEAQGVDGGASFELVEVLSFIQVPQHGGSVTTSRGAERAVGGNSHSVHVALVASEGSAELAGGQVPDLDLLVIATRDDDGVGGVGGEANAADPITVSLVDRVFTLSQGVPQLDALVTRSGDNLAVVRGEGDGEDILGVANEATSSHSHVQIPQANAGIPGGREGELSIRGENNIADKVVVSAEGTL